MAKMIGDRGKENHRDGGDDIIPKSTIRNLDDQQWMREFEEEILGDDYYHWQLRRRS